MAVSETSICNLALSRVGHDFLTALTDDTKAGRLCNLHYAMTRDAVLRDHFWNFATKRVTLAASVTTPAFEFGYSYPLPTDFLRLVRSSSDWLSTGCAYRIENGSILTDDSTFNIEYIYQCTDTGRFDPMFVDMLAQRLAAEICIGLTDNANMAASLWQIYRDKIAAAQATDSQEGTARDIASDAWINSRY
jgi:hypothetical protein